MGLMFEVGGGKRILRTYQGARKTGEIMPIFNLKKRLFNRVKKGVKKREESNKIKTMDLELGSMLKSIIDIVRYRIYLMM